LAKGGQPLNFRRKWRDIASTCCATAVSAERPGSRLSYSGWWLWVP
jgi:hypothetical protein